MPSKGGIALRGGDSALRILEFLCSALILGIFSYFLAYLTRHDQSIPTWMKAVEGMSGAAVIYTGFASLLTCFLGGITFFAFLALILDVLFCGAMVAIAILTRGGRHTAGQYSPLGNRRVRDAKFQTAVFAISIIAAFLFLVTAAMAVLLKRHHQKEKKYGPGPSNNYTSGTGKKPPFWKRNKKSNRDAEELGAFGAGSAAIAEEKHHKKNKRVSDIRPSHETGMTGSTAAAPDAYAGTPNKYAEPAMPTHHSNNSGYAPYTTQQQTGTTGYETGTAVTAPDNTYDGYGNNMNSNYGHSHTSTTTKVIHDPNPYAEIHNNGFPHQNPESKRY